MVKTYKKGYRFEWSFAHKLAKMGFMVIRAPRSGRIGLPSPDIIALKNNKMFVIECKSREGAFSIHSDQLDELKAWGNHGALPLIAWKQSHKDITLLHLDDVITNNGNIGKKFALEKGFPLNYIENLFNYREANK